MSKLAIVLCVALFATAANASFWSDEVQSIQSTIDSIVTTAISQVRARFESAKEKALDKLAKLEAAAEKMSQKLSEDVSAILQKVREDVKFVAERANGTDVTECTGLVSDLDNLSVEMYSEISGCVIDKIKAGVSYVDGMKTTTDSVHKRLTDLQNEGLRCSANVTGAGSALKALFCIRLVAAKATWATAKAVPSVTVSLTKLGYLLTTLQPSLSFCTTSKALITLSRQSAHIVRQVEKCVHRKIAEANFNKKEAEGDKKTTPATEGGSSATTASSTSSPSKEGTSTVKPTEPTSASSSDKSSSGKEGTSTDKPTEPTTASASSSDKSSSGKEGTSTDKPTEPTTASASTSDKSSSGKEGTSTDKPTEPTTASASSSDKSSSGKEGTSTDKPTEPTTASASSSDEASDGTKSP